MLRNGHLLARHLQHERGAYLHLRVLLLDTLLLFSSPSFVVQEATDPNEFRFVLSLSLSLSLCVRACWGVCW